MRKRIYPLILLFCTLAFADRVVIDTSMAASTSNDNREFEDRGSFGPYVECFRNNHEYFHTYFERKTGELRENDEFMLDYTTYFQPYVSLGITLF
ncbi:hypothetical protein SAMN05720470_106147 [Fibrobacter sp. UWOV1]|uniref:hypothetical protein n=1 Tax=Fibrobacter sp. UWOV1 TaxID=1896215 RepID=UPI00091CF4F6|nr:hypothetical protein [Fibrobacter sp. UWOV1]SHL27363.1 hypothetical protein SAMN05720470_106147 [Fibrobacter sp. UWOV1]